MSINQLIVRNLKKNLKNYYLYVFALIFSAALYFAFVTLQYDPSMDEAKGSIKGGAALKAASVLLIAIVAIFLLYANKIFIKRRSKEIGLFQLIGMTKSKIFRILTAENFLLYFGSVLLGILFGFAFSKLAIMILYKVTGVHAIATLHFSAQAMVQTIIVFAVIYCVIMLTNFIFIKRQTILSLFRAVSSTESKVKKISVLEIIMGILGLVLIIAGYYVSSKLFGGDFNNEAKLYLAMISILGSVILGTYLFYKGSVRFVFNLIRKKKNGYLSVNEVLSLSSIMFRMKSNALLLTIITTVSALAIGLLSLTYISYYSAEKTARNYVPNQFSFTSTDAAGTFKKELNKNNISFKETNIEVLHINADISSVMEAKLEASSTATGLNPKNTSISVISDSSVNGQNLSKRDMYLTGVTDLQKSFFKIKDSGQIIWKTKKEKILQNYIGMKKDSVVSIPFTRGLPTAVVNDSVFRELKDGLDPSLKTEPSRYVGIDVTNENQLQKADDLFQKQQFKAGQFSRVEMLQDQKQNMGLTMFIVGFLGLTFLITSGCILYFKQMDESEEEKPNYTILRKLGFTRGDLLKGIRFKQLFNFGIPLVLGLIHSYFAVKSGWFLFGTELWTPIILVMVLYTALYSIFGILSVVYYKKVIKEAL
ncbi:bacitracin transport system permease protein [Fictibacillus enclensis]|uniref:Bacitracin ABC transporter permease n=1 Tax=Fictibacillus enclensis TaxID=1017270 RepID=A0A0V8J4B0_9BACL|nr:ABC transporter permease [Fictibacillus enclensis]KSU82002.1 bacitracin ABC transporter permease [Fictibacillus enclensis]SCC28895.1 bacitracin transport system permease protein [Fictibacillus enclensis]